MFSFTHGSNQAIKCPKGFGAAHSVGSESDIALEIPHRRIGQYPEDAIGPSTIKAEPGQPLLQSQDVVADHEVAGVKQYDSVTESPACLIKVAKGLRTDNAINRNSAVLLKRTDGVRESFVVSVRCSMTTRGFKVAKSRQPLSDVGNLRAGIPWAQHGLRHDLRQIGRKISE